MPMFMPLPPHVVSSDTMSHIVVQASPMTPLNWLVFVILMIAFIGPMILFITWFITEVEKLNSDIKKLDVENERLKNYYVRK